MFRLPHSLITGRIRLRLSVPGLEVGSTQEGLKTEYGTAPGAAVILS